jgi:hypothetical protein
MELLRQPFPGGLADPARLNTLVEIIPLLSSEHQLEVLALFEPNPAVAAPVPGVSSQNLSRISTHPRTQQAEHDLQEFLRHSDRRLDDPAASVR